MKKIILIFVIFISLIVSAVVVYGDRCPEVGEVECHYGEPTADLYDCCGPGQCSFNGGCCNQGDKGPMCFSGDECCSTGGTCCGGDKCCEGACTDEFECCPGINSTFCDWWGGITNESKECCPAANECTHPFWIDEADIGNQSELHECCTPENFCTNPETNETKCCAVLGSGESHCTGGPYYDCCADDPWETLWPDPREAGFSEDNMTCCIEEDKLSDGCCGYYVEDEHCGNTCCYTDDSGSSLVFNYCAVEDDPNDVLCCEGTSENPEEVVTYGDGATPGSVDRSVQLCCEADKKTAFGGCCEEPEEDQCGLLCCRDGQYCATESNNLCCEDYQSGICVSFETGNVECCFTQGQCTENGCCDGDNQIIEGGYCFLDSDLDEIPDVIDDCPDDYDNDCDTNNQASEDVPVEGGRVQTTNSRATIDVPAATFGFNKTITIAGGAEGFSVNTPTGTAWIERSYALLPEGLETSIFDSMALTLDYDQGAMAECNSDMEEYKMDIYYYNNVTDEWGPLEAIQDCSENDLTTYINHFSEYGVGYPQTGGPNLEELLVISYDAIVQGYYDGEAAEYSIGSVHWDGIEGEITFSFRINDSFIVDGCAIAWGSTHTAGGNLTSIDTTNCYGQITDGDWVFLNDVDSYSVNGFDISGWGAEVNVGDIVRCKCEAFYGWPQSSVIKVSGFTGPEAVHAGTIGVDELQLGLAGYRHDPDGDGVRNAYDCAPEDPNKWRLVDNLGTDNDMDGYVVESTPQTFCVGRDFMNNGLQYFEGSTKVNSSDAFGEETSSELDFNLNSPQEGGEGPGPTEPPTTVSFSTILDDYTNDEQISDQWDIDYVENGTEIVDTQEFVHHKVMFRDTTLDTSTFDDPVTEQEFWLKLIFHDGATYADGNYYCGYVFYNDETTNDTLTHIVFTHTARDSYLCDGDGETPITDVTFDFNYSETSNSNATSQAGLTIDTVNDYIDYSFKTSLLPANASVVGVITGKRGSGIINDEVRNGEILAPFTLGQSTADTIAEEAHFDEIPIGTTVPEFSTTGLIAVIVIVGIFMSFYLKKRGRKK